MATVTPELYVVMLIGGIIGVAVPIIIEAHRNAKEQKRSMKQKRRESKYQPLFVTNVFLLRKAVFSFPFHARLRNVARNLRHFVVTQPIAACNSSPPTLDHKEHQMQPCCSRQLLAQAECECHSMETSNVELRGCAAFAQSRLSVGLCHTCHEELSDEPHDHLTLMREQPALPT